jgi:hypothetical protein
MIGEPLKAHLRDKGHTLHTLVRREPTNPSEHRWYPEKGVIESGIIDHVDAVVNLSGASIGKLPWTRKHKDLILSSRVQATHTIAAAIAASATPPAVLIQGSAVGFYGDRAEEDLTEDSAAGEGFLAGVVSAWEEAAAPAAGSQTRIVYARTGLVVGRGGAMAPLMLQTSLGVAGPVGSGTQWWPWVSLLDEVRALAYLIENPQAKGPYNLVGPTPARANDLARALAKRMKRPFWLGLPAFVIRAVMGEGGVSLLLTSQNIRSQKLQTEGFSFEDTTVDDALARMVNS